MSITIVVDENVPYAGETLGRLGQVESLPSRSITASAVRDAQVLVIRSVTKVDEALLSGSAVKFVGTATIGYDHVDLDYLSARGIQFASAPGSNANSVAEYVSAALLQIANAAGSHLEGSSLAVVGVGNVGSRVVKKARALGMRCFLNDPPKQRQTDNRDFLPLNETLRNADFISMHVPLTRTGPDITYRMANRDFFQTVKPLAGFLNTSRGGVVDEDQLMQALAEKKVSLAVLDVWQNEPRINPASVQRAFLATSHIAGYSLEGKASATLMIYEAICRWLDQPPEVKMDHLLPPVTSASIDLSHETGHDEDFLKNAISRVYDIRQDDLELRSAMAQGEQMETRFGLLRKTYPNRREFHNYELVLPGSRRTLLEKASGLGFRVRSA